MSSDLSSTLSFVQGPVFRFCFALMMLGLARTAVMGATELAASWLVAEDRRVVFWKLRQRVVWFLFPHLLLRKLFAGGLGWNLYHLLLSICSFVFRVGAILVPAFMVAHVYLWERGLGVAWPSLPPNGADRISMLTIIAGVLVFLGRLYSPLLRKVEPAWCFAKPLILILPFVTGVLAMHPTWSPLSYQAVMLMHVLAACLVLVLLPFAHLFRSIHTPVTRWFPETNWRAEVNGVDAASPEVRAMVTA